jgi:hypothetical protein
MISGLDRTMALFKTFRDIYSLDTLDTRFTISSTTPPKEALSARSASTKSDGAAEINAEAVGPAAERIKAQAGPSRWSTPEYYFYYLAISISVAGMIVTVYNQSKGLSTQIRWEMISNSETFRNLSKLREICTASLRWLALREESSMSRSLQPVLRRLGASSLTVPLGQLGCPIRILSQQCSLPLSALDLPPTSPKSV